MTCSSNHSKTVAQSSGDSVQTNQAQTSIATRLILELQNPEGYSDIPTEEQIHKWLAVACQEKQLCSVSLRIVGTEEARILNREYRSKDYATNILSFPFEAPPIPLSEKHLGDLVLCKQVAGQEAQSQNKAVFDHWAHLLIHGMLHLQGMDHLTEAEAAEMESIEIRLLQNLGINNPYKNQ